MRKLILVCRWTILVKAHFVVNFPIETEAPHSYNDDFIYFFKYSNINYILNADSLSQACIKTYHRGLVECVDRIYLREASHPIKMLCPCQSCHDPHVSPYYAVCFGKRVYFPVIYLELSRCCWNYMNFVAFYCKAKYWELVIVITAFWSQKCIGL